LFFSTDVNRDQRLDLNEFRNLIAQRLGHGSTNFAASASGGGPYAGSSYESSSSAAFGDVSGAGRGYSGIADLAGATIGGAGFAGDQAGYSSYGQSSYTSASGGDAGGFDANASAGFGVSGFNASASSEFGVSGLEASGSSGINFSSENTGVSSASTFEASTSQQQVQVDGSNPHNLFQDPNPQIIRRPAQGGSLTYTQSIKIRFLQPPPVPPPGVSFLPIQLLFPFNCFFILATHH
jgi:hypothetical protein